MDKKILYKISCGMYVVSSKKGNRFNGQIANAVFQVTADLPRIAVCINKQNLTHQFIRESRVFSVSVLEQNTPMKFIGRFGFKSGRELEKFEGIDYKPGITGAAVVTQNCLGYLECETVDSVDAGTHTVFIGKVVDTGMVKEGEPLTYAYYHQVKGGKAPPNAPTYIKEESPKPVKETKTDRRGEMTQRLQVYKCEICGNIVEVMHQGVGQLVCCGQEMKLLGEKSEEQGSEKHVPVIEQTENGVKVKVGSISHPMEEKHYIEWIELIAGNKVYRRYLKPGDLPEAELKTDAEKIKA